MTDDLVDGRFTSSKVTVGIFAHMTPAAKETLDELDRIAQTMLDFVKNPDNFKDVAQTIRVFKVVRDYQESMQAVKTKVEEAVRIMAYGVVPNAMQNSDPPITNITIDGVGRVTLTDVLNVSVPPENKPAIADWLRENGLENIITETVNAQTFQALVKRRIGEKKEVPFDLINMRPETRASITSISKTI